MLSAVIPLQSASLDVTELEIALGNWERRKADALADAIAKHMQNSSQLTRANVLLSEVQVAVEKAGATVNTTESELRRHYSVVCKICRGSSLYECDVDEGWSVNCAFILVNSSRFADL
jgi:lipopolysaccharide biosynthesis regulator YciM